MRYYFDGDNNLYGRTQEGEFSLPSKTKQMGSIENEVKIYMEDYVYTYLYQYGKSGGGKEKLAALDALPICQPGFGAFLTAKDETFHREYFKEKWQTLFVLDTMDKLDSFYIYNEEGKGLRQAKGYFIYYDRNREMQEYMLENSMIRPREDAAEQLEQEEAGDGMRKRPTQAERMDAAREIRRVLERRAQAAEEAHKGHFRALAGVSCMLCVVCICMGLAMMSSLSRLQNLESELVAVQTSYQTLVEDMEGVKVTAFAMGQKSAAEEIQEGRTEEKEEVLPVSKEEEKQRYIVESGDSLGFISRKFYGDNSGISRIMEANDIWNSDMIYEGQALWIP